MNRRKFFGLLGAGSAAALAVVAVPSVAVASGCIATASNTKFDSSGWETMQRLSADAYKRAEETLAAIDQIANGAMSAMHFSPEFTDPCRNVPSAPGADGYDYTPPASEI